jgi:LEA14-like dessication related protein
MKKVLLFSGIGLAGFGLYRYFKYQVNLALNYDYKIKKFKVLKYDNKNIDISLEIEIENKSNFDIIINEYDLKIFFKGQNIGSTKTKTPFTVLPKSSFTLKVTGQININETKISVFPFIQDVLARRPINIEVLGFINVKFLGINHTLKFNKDKFQYSADLLTEVGLNKQVSAFKLKYPQIAKILGIK